MHSRLPQTDSQPQLNWLAEGRPVSRAHDPNPRRRRPRFQTQPQQSGQAGGRLPEVYFGLTAASAFTT